MEIDLPGTVVTAAVSESINDNGKKTFIIISLNFHAAFISVVFTSIYRNISFDVKFRALKTFKRIFL